MSGEQNPVFGRTSSRRALLHHSPSYPPPPSPILPFLLPPPAGGSRAPLVPPQLPISELVSQPVSFPPPPFQQSPSQPSSRSAWGSSGCLPAEPARCGPPPGRSPGPRRSGGRTPPLGPGPLLTSQTSAPETEPERYTGTGSPPTARRSAVATATRASTPRSSNT